MLNVDDKLLYKKLPAFHFVREMNELCKSFFKYSGANYFDYNRFYDNNSLLTLTSDGDWLEHFFEKKYKLCVAFKKSGMHLWDSYYYQVAIHDAKINFNHDYGITIINKREHYIEYIDIAAPQNNREITSLYLNNMDKIEHFISFFAEQSENLIMIAEKKLIKIPEALCFPVENKKCVISNREKQCLELYLAGNTAKETADILNISYRTVEEYINNLKKKTRCRHKRELLKIFNKERITS